MIYTNWTINFSKLPEYTAFKGKFQEHIPYDLLKLINETDFSNIDGYRPEHKDLVKTMLNNIDPRDNVNWIERRYATGMKCGRFFPNDTTGLKKCSIIQLPRYIKHTIFKILGWKDIDMKRCHPTIIYEIAKKQNRIFKSIEKYLKERDTILEEMKSHYQISFDVLPSDIDTDEKKEKYIKHNTLTNDDIKDLFNCITFGGGFNTWYDELCKNGKNIKNPFITQFVKEYQSDIMNVMDLVYLNNPELVNDVVDKLEKEEKYQKMSEDNKLRKVKRTALHFWCATIENECLHIAYKFALKQKIIMERYNVSPEYDGFPFKPVKDFDETAFLVELNEKIKKDMKIEIVFDFKPFERVIDSIVDLWNVPVQIATPVANTISADSIDMADLTLDTASNYYEWKSVFEKHHCKIVNKVMFIKAVKDVETDTFKEFITFNEKELKSAYGHYTYLKETKTGIKICKYIDDWLVDKNMLYYEDIDCVPPPLKCNDKIFNTWSPFYITQVVSKYSTKDENGKYSLYVDGDTKEEIEKGVKEIEDKASYIINHIKGLCNDEKIIYDYVLRWIGQMFMYPHLKTKAIILISEEGAGKGTIMKIIKRMVGVSKYLETTKPDEDVWGKFNPLMLDAYFVNINEMELKKTENALGVIKGLITDIDMTINCKGKNQIKAKSYHRYWFSTNNEVPMNPKKDDRRFMLMRCNDKYIGDMEHFTKLNEYLDDDQVLVALYLYLISLPNLDTFHKEPQPITEYQKTISDANRAPLDLFLEHYTQEHFYDKDTTKCLYTEEIFAEFKNWCENKSLKWEMNAIKFGRSLGLMKLPNETIRTYKKGVLEQITIGESVVYLHTNKGNKIAIDLDKLKKHYGMIAPVIEDQDENMEIDQD